jgi:hypothetical protein
MPGRTPAVATAAARPNSKCTTACDQVVAELQPMFSQLSMEGNLTANFINQQQIMTWLKTAEMQTIVSRPSLKGIHSLVIKT